MFGVALFSFFMYTCCCLLNLCLFILSLYINDLYRCYQLLEYITDIQSVPSTLKFYYLLESLLLYFVNCLDQCSLIKHMIKYKFEDEILKLSFVTCISTIGNLFSDDDSNSNGSMMVFTRLGVEQLMSNWEFSMSLKIHDSVPYSCCV